MCRVQCQVTDEVKPGFDKMSSQHLSHVDDGASATSDASLASMPWLAEPLPTDSIRSGLSAMSPGGSAMSRSPE